MGRAWKMSQKKGHLKGAQKRGVEPVLWKWMGAFQTRGNKKQEGRKVWDVFQEYLGKTMESVKREKA